MLLNLPIVLSSNFTYYSHFYSHFFLPLGQQSSKLLTVTIYIIYTQLYLLSSYVANTVLKTVALF